MKNGYSILTRRMQGMDMRVWLTMVCLVLISCTILAFKITGRKECKIFKIDVTEAHASGNDKFYPKDDVAFAVKEAGTIRWDFGDSFSAEGARVKHQYVSDGEYTVTAMLNGQCVQKTIVTINRVFVDSTKLPEDDPIWAPATITAGKKAAFAYNGARKITAFEWSIVNSQIYPVQNGKVASFNFITAGEQTVRLTLNDGKVRTYDKTITVLPEQRVEGGYTPNPKPSVVKAKPKPSSPKEQENADKPVMDEKPAVAIPIPSLTKKNTAESASDGELLAIFEGITKGTRHTDELYKYLCSGGSTKVIAKKKGETAASICGMMAGKKWTLKNFVVHRDPNNCVDVINFTYKKGWWDVF